MTYYPATTADFVSNATTASKESVNPSTGPGVNVPAPASRVVHFEFCGSYSVAATTTGVGFGIDIPASATILAIAQVVTGSTGTDLMHQQILNADDTFTIPTDMAATSGFFMVKGKVVNSTTAGDIQLRVDTDAAAAVTIQKGVTRWGWDACAA